MKTMILATVSAVALLTAGAASAQQTFPYSAYTPNPVTQGNAQVSAAVDQTGTGNNASTTQDASIKAQNTSTIVQGFNGASANGSAATVNQSGAGQRAVTMQYNNNSSTIGQSGANNDAFTYQTGYGNTASTTQTGTSSPLHSGNIAGVNGAGSTGGGDQLAGSLANQSEAQVENTVENTGINNPSDPNNESATYIVQLSGAQNNGDR